MDEAERFDALIRGGFGGDDSLFRRGAQAVMAIFQAGADERREQRMRRQRLRFEFRMKLAADEPRMIRRFDNFDVNAVRRLAR